MHGSAHPLDEELRPLPVGKWHPCTTCCAWADNSSSPRETLSLSNRIKVRTGCSGNSRLCTADSTDSGPQTTNFPTSARSVQLTSSMPSMVHCKSPELTTTKETHSAGGVHRECEEIHPASPPFVTNRFLGHGTSRSAQCRRPRQVGLTHPTAAPSGSNARTRRARNEKHKRGKRRTATTRLVSFSQLDSRHTRRFSSTKKTEQRRRH